MQLRQKINLKTKRLLFCGPLGCLLFIVLFSIQGVLRKEYDPFRFPLSSLSIGESGWVQITNFILSGLLIFLFAFGLKQATAELKGSKWISRLIGAAGIGLIGAGFFSTDPVYGYPITEPLKLAQFTVHGHLHDFFSIFVFVCLPISCFKFYHRFKESGNTGWAYYSLISGIGMIIMFILAAIGFKQIAWFVDFAGVFQRLSIIIGCGWIMMLAFHIIKTKKQLF